MVEAFNALKRHFTSSLILTKVEGRCQTIGQSECEEKEELEKGTQCLVAQLPAQLSGKLLWFLCFSVSTGLPLRVHLRLQATLIAGGQGSVRRGFDMTLSSGLGSSGLQTATRGELG